MTAAQGVHRNIRRNVVITAGDYTQAFHEICDERLTKERYKTYVFVKRKTFELFIEDEISVSFPIQTRIMVTAYPCAVSESVIQ